MRCNRGKSLLAGLAVCVLIFGCERDERPAADATPAATTPTPQVQADPLTGDPVPSILLAKAQFAYETDAQGRRRPVPGPAKLVIVRKTAEGWRPAVIEDAASNVFHKAAVVTLPGMGEGILTIGGTAAVLRFWQWDGGRWTHQALWNPSFGGKWDRLRDFEVGDVNGNGDVEIVVSTHDQGVVAVVSRGPEGWDAQEIDRAPRTFVHEIELADADGDGVMEIFATPSQPNRSDMKSQAGAIVMYRWNGEAFERRTVATFENTHAKEILAVDLDGDEVPVLLAAVEAETAQRGGRMDIVRPVEIRRYHVAAFAADADAAGGATYDVIATLDDAQCRFLSPGDVDHDGQVDIVAAGMRSGLWLLRRGNGDAWSRTLIDRDSSGYEHATLVCDLDGDGADEVVVASDVQGELRVYRWREGRFEKEVIMPTSPDEITFGVSIGRL